MAQQLRPVTSTCESHQPVGQLPWDEISLPWDEISKNARAMSGREVRREIETIQRTSKTDHWQPVGAAVVTNNGNATLRFRDMVRSAAKQTIEHISNALRCEMELALAELEGQLDKVDGVRSPPAYVSKRDNKDPTGSIAYINDTCMRAALRSVADITRAFAPVADDASAAAKLVVDREKNLTSEDGLVEQHFPGYFPCADGLSHWRATFGGLLDILKRFQKCRTLCTPHTNSNNIPRAAEYRVVCDVCGTTVRGRRFKCQTCADYDLCESCKLKGHHANHSFQCIACPAHAIPSFNSSILCNFCDNKVSEGDCHHCLECPDFDLCGACFLSSRWRHPHQFCPRFPRHNVASTAILPATTGQASGASQTAARSEEKCLEIHDNVQCDGCGKVIEGTRFKCGNCDDFDLCSNCEAKSEHDQNHVFLKIRHPVPFIHPGVLLPPLYGPDIRHRFWQTQNHDSCPARVERSMETIPFLHHMGTETVVLQKSDQAIGTEQPAMASSETQTNPTAATRKEANVQTAAKDTVWMATASSHTQTSNVNVVERQSDVSQADFLTVESTVGKPVDHDGDSQCQESVGIGDSTMLIVHEPGEADNKPLAALLATKRNNSGFEMVVHPNYCCRNSVGHASLPEERVNVEEGSGSVKGTAVDLPEVEPDDTIQSIVSANIEDEFVMVSENLKVEAGQGMVAEARQIERFAYEVDEEAVTSLSGCFPPITTSSSIHILNNYTGKRLESSNSLPSSSSTRFSNGQTADGEDSCADMKKLNESVIESVDFPNSRVR